MIGVIHAKQTGKKSTPHSMKVAENPLINVYLSGQKFWKLMAVVR